MTRSRLTVQCKIEQPYIERPMAGDFRYIIYNRDTGFVVGSTYSPQMARAMLHGISCSPDFMDSYGITELYEYPLTTERS